MKRLLTVAFLLSIFLSVQVQAERPEGEKKKQEGLQKVAEDEAIQVDFISINNCLMWIRTDGMTAHNPQTDGSGFEWPKNTAQNVIFTDGIIWGGLVESEIRVGGATYRYGLQNGKILPSGEAADIDDPRYRLYKIRKVDTVAYNNNLTVEEQDRLRRDFTEWPVEDGAPWVDNNGNGVYEPNFEDWLERGDSTTTDTPWFVGDEVIWFVSNDLNGTRTNNLYGTAPIGLELHTMVWGYDQTGPLGNIVFTKYTVINKSSFTYNDAYFSKWSDPDLGDAFDDYVGIDTLLSLGYVYNGLAKDEIYKVPPAAGYDFFQGPIVPTETNDTVAIFNFGLKEGHKNLPVSTFAFYINGDGVYTDPSLGRTFGATMMYNYQRGLLWNGTPYIDPSTGETTNITLAGDPLAPSNQRGWVDGILHAPGDRRFLMTAGPFTLSPTDTQEVVVATIVGLGADRLSSINVLKFYDEFAQFAFDNNFDLPQAPPSPNVLVSAQDEEITLTWGDPSQVNFIENFEDKGFKFQGYNIYQFPRASARIDEAVRIATFDIEDGRGTIFDTKIDPSSGIPVQLPVQFGTDSGIDHLITITSDAITDKPLVNNQPYYFAVTSYSWNPDDEAFPKQLESTPQIITVRPKLPDPGVRYGVPYNDRILPRHEAGASTGIIDIIAVDPERLNGDTYEITFQSLGDTVSFYNEDLDDANFIEDTLTLDNAGAWTLKNLTKNTTVINRVENLDGLEKDFFVVDGFAIGVNGQGFYQQFTDTTRKADEYFVSNEILQRRWFGGPEVYEPGVGTLNVRYEWLPGYWSVRLGGTENVFGSAIKGYNTTKSVELVMDRDELSKGYCYERERAGEYYFKGYFETPLRVFDVSDSLNPKQLSFAWIEPRGEDEPTNDEVWAPSADDKDRDFLFIIDEPYSETPKAEYTDPDFNFGEEAENMPILYFGAYKLRTQNLEQRYPWQDGDGWKIIPNVAFTTQDRYTFTTLEPTKIESNIVSDVDNINVFPNPYLGANDQELNKYQRFVTFSHLPTDTRVNFRVFTLSGTLVRSFAADEVTNGTDMDGTQWANWDLQNDNGLPVGSGIYIIHIDMPDLGTEKVLKLGVVQERQFLDRI
ncbi:MAG: hypothetical protein CL946_09945 [Ectothiorhodospiraceae bacterium]|nr:hypothetical protein [Ectothiorhodospiraceae bacterium]